MLTTAMLSGLLTVGVIGTESASAMTLGNQMSVFAGLGWNDEKEGLASNSPIQTLESVATDGSGNVFVADSANHRVVKISSSGILSFFAGLGTSPLGLPTDSALPINLMSPVAIATDAVGNVYIADSGAGMVLKVTADGQMLSILASGIAPTAVAVDASNGDLYYNDGTDLIWVPAGGSGQTVESGYPGIRGLVVNPTTHIVYISDSSGSVRKRLPGASGTLSLVSSGLQGPRQLALDANGSLYVADAGAYPSSGIKRITSPDTSPTTSVFAGGGSGTGLPAAATAFYVSQPRGVAIDPSGTVYIADTGNHFVEKIPAVPTPSEPVRPVVVSGDSSIQVTFTAPISSGDTPIDHYDVSTNYGYTWTQLSTEAGGPFTISGLTNGTGYWVKVRAHNSHGNGYETPAVSVTPAVVLTAPGTPTHLIADAGNAQALLSFTVPASGGSPITGYGVSIGGGDWTSLNGVTVSDSTASAVLTGLTNGTTYQVRVRAANVVDYGPASAAVPLTPVAPGAPVAPVVSSAPVAPGAPSTPSAVAGIASVTVSWSAQDLSTGVTGYTVSASPGPAICSTFSASATSCVIGAVAGTSYTYTLIAHSAVGDSPASGSSAAVSAALPLVADTAPVTAPTTLTTTDGVLATVLPAQRVTVVGAGFAPYSTAEVSIYSSPILLATVSTDAGGAFSTPVVVPAGLETGAHNLVASGVDAAGVGYVVRMPVTLVRHATAAASAPSKVKVSTKHQRLTVSFNAATARAGLTLTRYQVTTDGGRRWATVRPHGLTRLQVRLTGLATGRTYLVQVRALTSAGAGAASARVKVKCA